MLSCQFRNGLLPARARRRLISSRQEKRGGIIFSRHRILFPIALACLLGIEGPTRSLAQDRIEGPARPALNSSTADSDSSAAALFVPVILKASGRNNSFFTSELTLTNRGEEPARLHYTYTAHAGGGSGTAAETLAAGRQNVVPDAIDHLRSLGIPLPASGNRIGTLRVEVEGASQVGVTTRTATTVPDGRAGLTYPGIAVQEGFRESVWLCGLRQNDQDRSNVAFQNLGTPEQGSITMRATVYSGSGATGASMLEEVTLGPGGFHQFSGVLGSVSNGYVKVERVKGSAPFYAYGVINDNFNSDGSFVFPVREESLAGRRGQTLPVIIETGRFTSELTVTNFSAREKVIRFSFEAGQHAARFRLRLRAGQQRILPRIVDWMRRQDVKGIGPANRAYVGALFAQVDEGDMSGIVVGARTGSPDRRGGQYGLFYNGAPDGAAWTDSAWIYGLQQNGENRSNLALVNTGEEDGGDSSFTLEIYDGETGTLANTVTGLRVAARGWRQVNAILGHYAPGVTQGYVRIIKRSGNNPFLAYGVINDGGGPGERSGDGAYLPATGTILDRGAEALTDREVLERLYHAAGGLEWQQAHNWLSDRPLSEWYGVVTEESGRVTSLNLPRNGLSGAIPPELGQLSQLELLFLHTNQLRGAVPPELGQLSRLQTLFLSSNQLSGSIPPALGQLSRLQTLLLDNNQLSGSIPLELGQLSKLQRLNLSANQLSGNISPELGRLSQLQRLILSGNQLSGTIPPALGQLSRLQDLALHQNRLSGAIPPALGQLSRLQDLNLHGNRLSGAIPPALTGLSQLRTLYFFDTRICTPPNAALRVWLARISDFRPSGLVCDGTRRIVFSASSYAVREGDSVMVSVRLVDQTENPSPSVSLALTASPGGGATEKDYSGVPEHITIVAPATEASFRFSAVAGDGFDPGETVVLALGQPLPPGVAVGEPAAATVMIHDPGTEALTDREVLEALHHVAGGPAWSNRTHWLSDLPLAEWFGVDTDENGRVTSLSLPGNGLSGAIPLGLGQLSHLQHLNLGARRDSTSQNWFFNRLNGSIPLELGRLSQLQTLSLNGNQLNGSIPFELGQLSHLQILSLWGNQLSGPIPPELGQLSQLQALYLNGNQLSGAIPPELGQLSRLQTLLLYSNQLSGSIPPELGQLSQLQALYLNGNQLSGTIPPALGQLSQVQTLLLDGNQLSGSIPPELGQLSQLQTWYLYGNQLSGAIPPELGQLSRLQTWFLGSNQLSGSIPSELGRLSQLQALYLNGNQLSGSIPSELGQLSRLQALYLDRNQLSGSIPPELGQLSQLQTLYLFSNQLSGSIPPELGQLSQLQALYLNSNKLSGSIPPELGGLTNLQTLHLAYNPDLTASDTSWLQELPLVRLNLAATQVCVPEDAAFQKRLETIEFTPSGLACGRPVPAMSSIDVAVFYTAGARDKAGGTAAVEAEIDLMVAETNRAYEDSGASQRIILVAREELEYTESGSGFTDLERLRAPSDGQMDEVRAVRDREGADLVHLISSVGDVGGVADLPGVFGVTCAGCDAAVFAHELGHNMGLSHDRYVEGRTLPGPVIGGAPSGRSLLPYSYGYVNQQAFVAGAPESAHWRTIMSYSDQCDAADLHCEVLLRFSNPSQTWLGDPMGVPGEERTEAVDGPVDAVRALNATRHSVAALRPRSMASRLSMFSPLSQRRSEAGNAVGPLPVPGGNLFQTVAPGVRVRDSALHAGRSTGGGVTLRRREVGVDLGMLARVPAGRSGALRLNLFDDVVVTGIIERRTPTYSGGFALSGRLAGVPGGTLTLVVNGNVVAGAVRGPGALYRIRPAGRGRHDILQTDPSQSSWRCGTGQQHR